jgi:hypothetical protein
VIKRGIILVLIALVLSLVAFHIFAVLQNKPVTLYPAKPEAPERPRSTKRSSHIYRVEKLAEDDPVLKHWPMDVEAAVLSPDHRKLALYDGKGMYLTDRHGRNRKRLYMPPGLSQDMSDLTGISYAFDATGRWLAILSHTPWGEPHVCYTENLWKVNTRTLNILILARWEDCTQGTGPVVAYRRIDGWTTDGRLIVVSGEVWRSETGDLPSDQTDITGQVWFIHANGMREGDDAIGASERERSIEDWYQQYKALPDSTSFACS